MSTETVLIAAIGLLIGIGIGFFIGRSSMAKAAEHSAEIEAELQKIKQDTDDYRYQVNHHFEKTAELVGELTNSYKDMTQRYKKVYEHLAQGAQTLASVDTSKMIVASTIDQLIYEANEDTHVAEKSSKAPAKTAAKQPKSKTPDIGGQTTKPASGEAVVKKVAPEKNNGKKAAENTNKEAEKKTSAAESKPEQPPRKTGSTASTTGEKKEEASLGQKEPGKK